jgi:hypothetical protein
MVSINPKTSAVCGLGLFLVIVAGCGGKSLEYADAVEGTLTLDGTPIPGARLEFVPDVPPGTKAPSSSAVTDAKGFFSLTRSDSSRPGAVVGSHRVVIYPGRTEGGKDRDDPGGRAIQAKQVRVPPVYMNLNQTPLRVEVKQEQKTYDLRLNRVPSRQR